MGGSMEVDELIEKLKQVTAERDAAIADIKRSWICDSCKKREYGYEWQYCKHKRFVEQINKVLTCENFEWRGVKNNGCKQQTEGRTV
jgi:hypothetical protein